MPPLHILVAEDDANIRLGLVDTLEDEGYEVTAVEDGQAALDAVAEETFDLLLLDIMMPVVNGYDVCRDVRQRHHRLPIIMLTAKGQEVDKVVGLELGADDYVTKPFGVHELLARIRAVLRRTRPRADKEAPPDSFRFGPAEIDRRTYRGSLGDSTFELTAREMDLLLAFHAHPREVLTRTELMRLVWGQKYHGTTRTLDQHVAQLRKKVEPDPHTPRVITTAHGLGYRYEGTELTDA